MIYMTDKLVACCAVAVDGSDASLQAVSWACRVTGVGGAVVMIDIQDFTPLFSEMGMVPYGGGPDLDLDDISRQWNASADTVRDKAMAIVTASGREGSWHVRAMRPGDGVPAAVFCKVAEEHGAEVLIVGQHHGSTRIEGLFGSFPRWVITHGHLPVLTVPIPLAPVTHP
jgi:nucleotide-binding universal stress UspA family protein